MEEVIRFEYEEIIRDKEISKDSEMKLKSTLSELNDLFDQFDKLNDEK